MGSNSSILLDLNIILDVYQKREPFFETSAGLLAAVESGRVQGYVAAQSITTLFYLVQEVRSAADARAIITNLLQFLKVLPVDQSAIEQALNLDYHDFEDAVQMISAVQSKMDCLITRNIKYYQAPLLPLLPLLPIMQPAVFLSTLS